MRSIQEVGLEIANKTPAKFYVFLGPEYGIKCRYLAMIKDVYDGRVIEADSCSLLFSTFKQKRLIPLPDSLYIIRYDLEFASQLSPAVSREIANLKIPGTIVCLYDDSKLDSKFDKNLPKYSVVINNVTPQMEQKYLTKDFPKLSSRFQKLAVTGSNDYGHAQQICYAMSSVSEAELGKLSDTEILKMFGYDDSTTEDQFKLGIAARNPNYLIQLLDRSDTDRDDILYCILSTMVELDKLSTQKYSDSPIKKYSKLWNYQDIYYMFNHGYAALKRFRSMSVDKDIELVMLFSLLGFQRIPSKI